MAAKPPKPFDAVPGAAAASGGALGLVAIVELMEAVPDEYGPAGVVVVALLYLGMTAIRLNRETFTAIDSRFDALELVIANDRDDAEQRERRLIRMEERLSYHDKSHEGPTP